MSLLNASSFRLPNLCTCDITYGIFNRFLANVNLNHHAVPSGVCVTVTRYLSYLLSRCLTHFTLIGRHSSNVYVLMNENRSITQ
jgi:hypothetical protein